MPAERTRRWTARQVRQLIAEAPLATPRYELVDGELLVTPSPAYAHQQAGSLLHVALAKYLEKQPVGHALTSPSDVEVEPGQVTQPDVYVVPTVEARRLAEHDFPAHELLLAIEVISPSTARYDRVTKRALYQRHVPEYWIVDVDAHVVERWRQNEDRPEILTQTLEWLPTGATSALQLDLAAFFGGKETAGASLLKESLERPEEG